MFASVVKFLEGQCSYISKIMYALYNPLIMRTKEEKNEKD